MAVYRATAYSTVIMKMHILEDDVLDFVSKFKVGLGFLGEQGGESIHNKFNELERTMMCMPNPLQALLKEHHRQTFPGTMSRFAGYLIKPLPL